MICICMRRPAAAARPDSRRLPEPGRLARGRAPGAGPAEAVTLRAKNPAYDRGGPSIHPTYREKLWRLVPPGALGERLALTSGPVLVAQLLTRDTINAGRCAGVRGPTAA